MCKFFLWHDQVNSTDKDVVIGQLVKKVEDMKEIQRMLVFGLVMCSFLVVIMAISLGICAVKK